MTSNIFPYVDDLYFWSIQTLEHMLVLEIGIIMPDDKKMFSNLRKQWIKFIDINFVSKGIEFDPDRTFLTGQELNIIGKVQSDGNLIMKTINTLTIIVNKLNAGKWLGWIYPTLASHILDETIYFRRKMHGPLLTLAEEVKFIDQNNAEGMNIISQLLDPTEEQLITAFKSYAIPPKHNITESNYYNYINIEERNKMMELSIMYGEELIRLANVAGLRIKNHTLKTVMPPLMPAHSTREFIRFNVTLKVLHSKLINNN